MDPEFLGQRNHQDWEPQVEGSEPDFEIDDPVFDGDQGIDWEPWWQIIVHRNGGIQEAEPPEYPPEAWSLDSKDVPFPFNLDETWYCTAVLVLILLIHSELDTEWLLRHGYTHYFARISFRIILTVSISFLSTLAFEVAGNILDLARETVIDMISLHIKALFVEYLGWGPVDEEGRANWENRVPFYQDTTYIREPAIELVIGIVISAFHCSVMTHISVIQLATGAAISWLVGLLPNHSAKFLVSLPSYFALPIPETDGLSSITNLLWEYGVPSIIQVWTAAFLYLFVFLFMSRAETPIILRQGGQDPFCKLAFQLLRATAMHLLAYTAYQITSSCVIASQSLSLRFNVYALHDSMVGHKVLERSNLELSLGAGVLIMATHWLVKNACRRLVAFCWPSWVSYVAWLSIKTEESTWRNWAVYGSLLDDDMDVLDPGKRVTARALMTVLFGLKSSWPARMRLSTGDNID
ncbi:uncharacterized protein F4812DRAFT_447171 [Daldinia caldariorum]|uniref:uncharacterized protein n=1 Tax=Daldinia caldariorum TaxID=326644 RepID=UPI002008B035|nr:uncharacterized protein F4812DRAFT_447171 [Daldinia caldariorum]KAI1463280.1 hypothetical protein F4812DRAFT_447171 [Daldinia caldariorum]